jgi:carbonic anhydrase
MAAHSWVCTLYTNKTWNGGFLADYELCQTGTMQSPIPLRIDQGLSQQHIITLDANYGLPVAGHFYNWGYGPAFELSQDSGCTNGTAAHGCTNLTGLPSFSFHNDTTAFKDDVLSTTKRETETVYLISWHIHAPADHTVQGDRSKAELHLVHVNSAGDERAVLAVRIDPGIASYSPFIAQLPLPSSGENSATPAMSTFPSFQQLDRNIPITNMNMGLAMLEAGDFQEFWTYRGSLTSPPCREGVRFFVARQIMFVSNAQMQDVLRISRFSARDLQQVWMHQINV